MAKDATPPAIKLVNDNFANANHEKIAGILDDEWSASTKFTELGEEYEAHRSTFQDVYSRYFGVPEHPYNDRIEDNRTITQIKDDHNVHDDKGAMNTYLELRERGDLNPDAYPNVEYKDGYDPDSEERMISLKKSMEKRQEEYRKGYRDGHRDALEGSN